jgi:hypothetical protein
MTAEVKKQGNPWDNGVSAEEMKQVRQRLHELSAKHKTFLKLWTGDDSRGHSPREKIIAMLEFAFEDYLKIHDTDEALELIMLHWNNVLRRKSTVQ